MAKLEIELSEYDAMREARKAAETRVAELQEELKDLKKGSKVILRRETKYLAECFDTSKLEEIITQQLKEAQYRRTYCGGAPLNIQRTVEICIDSLTKVRKEFLPISTTKSFPTESDTLIGFEDVRIKVESMFKEQFKEEHRKALEALKSEKDAYTVKYNQIHEELFQEFKETINNLEEKNKKLEKENNSLKEQLEKASRSTEEKIAEAEAKVKAAQEELANLKGKKHWWKKK